MKVRNKSHRIYYLYGLAGTGVLSHAQRNNLEGLEGTAVEYMNIGDIVVIYGRLPSHEYSADSLREKVRDLNWLERRSSEHYHVQEALASNQCPVIPFKFCTIFKTRQKIKEYVSEKSGSAKDLLQRLKGKQEWGVKVFRNRDELKKHLVRFEPDLNSRIDVLKNNPDGRSYLLKKKLVRDIETSVSKFSTHHTRLLIDSLQEIGGESCQLETFAVPEKKNEEMLANFAFLLRLEDAGVFKAKVEEFNRLHSGRGLYACSSGPWLPYNFVDNPEVR